MSIFGITFGPNLNRVRSGSHGINYVQNNLEKYSTYTLYAVKCLLYIVKLSSPLLVVVLYRRGFFAFDNWDKKDFSSLFRPSLFVMSVAGLAYVVRAIGRASNPTYRNFLRSLADFERRRTTEGAERIVETFDCDFRALPTEHTVTAPLKRPITVPVVERDVSVVARAVWKVLALVLLKTIGRRMLYPGSLKLFNAAIQGALLDGRAKLMEEHKLRGKRAKIGTADGNSIDTMFVDNRSSTEPQGSTLVICCEGNAGFYELGIMNTPKSLGYSVLGWNHPGFGCSTGEPLPSQELHAVDAVMHYAMDHLKFPEQKILIFAWSIGGFPASWVAAAYPRIAGVVLDATFDDLLPLAEARMPKRLGTVVKYVVRHYLNLDIAGLLCQYNGPVLMVRRTLDEILAIEDLERKRLVNRADYLLTRVLSHRYPNIVNKETIPVLDEWLSARPDRQVNYGFRKTRDRTLRRVASKIVSKRSLHLATYLQPRQLGFATRNGCEAAVHAARHFVESRRHDDGVHAFLKVDVRNAFNCLDRNVILDAARQHLPLYQPYIVQCYGRASILLCEENVIHSRSGIQQGDPLGPLLYCLATSDAHHDLQSELNESYLDDDVLCGPAETVLGDFLFLENRLGALGLNVNVKKCEVFLFGGSEEERAMAYGRFRDNFPELPLVSAENLCYLGAPLLDEGFANEFEKTSAKVIQLIKKTSALPVHQAYFLVRSCLGPVKLIYLLRTTRGFRFRDVLSLFDESLRVSLATVFNTSFAETAWFQATLPIPYAGLGIRLTEGLALPAFLASAHSVSTLAQSIIPFNLDVYLGDSVEEWKTYSACPPPALEALGVQKCWDLPLAEATLTEIGHRLESDPTTLSRLKALRTQEASAWLYNVPVKSLFTLMEDEAFRIAICLMLGMEVCVAHKCVCGGWADSRGHHALACHKAGGRIPRRSALNAVVKRALTVAQVPSQLEPAGLVLQDGRRPDGMTLMPLEDGLNKLWDVTCVCTLAPSNIARSAEKAGGAANYAEGKKIDKYEDYVYRHYIRDVTDDHLTEMVEKFLGQCSITSPSQIVFPLEVGKDLDLATRQHLTLFLARLHMKDLHETHCTPLPASLFTRPWHPLQKLVD